MILIKMLFLTTSLNQQELEVHQFVCDVLWDAGREDLPVPVDSHWIVFEREHAIFVLCQVVQQRLLGEVGK